MKRRGALFVLAGAVALVVAAGVAFAATVKCQGGHDDAVRGHRWARQALRHLQTGRYERQAGRRPALRSQGGSDIMSGDTSSGQQETTDGNDQLYGNRGDDWLLGYGGSDLLKGGGGADLINAQFISSGNPGEDTVLGDGGEDSINANDEL